MPGLESSDCTWSVATRGVEIGDVEAVGTGAVLDALAESLRGERLDLLRLRMLTVDSGLHSEASSRAPALRLRRFAPKTTHWAARIPGSMDEFLAARSRERRKNAMPAGWRSPTATASRSGSSPARPTSTRCTKPACASIALRTSTRSASASRPTSASAG